MSITPNEYTCPEELIGIARDVETRLKNMNFNELKILSHEHLNEYLGPFKYKKTSRFTLYLPNHYPTKGNYKQIKTFGYLIK